MTASAPVVLGNRMVAIDSLRAIAALIVVYCHTWIGIGHDAYSSATFEFLRRDIFLNGHLGVTLFFVISGYVIPNSLLRHERANLRKFAISRLMRLYPAYWLSFLAAGILIGLPQDEPRVWLNLTMVQRLFSVPDLLGVYWTLLIELIFYVSMAVFFGLKLLGPGRKIDRLLTAVIAITLISSGLRWSFNIPLPAGNLMFLCLMYFGAWLRLAEYDSAKLAWTTTLFLVAMLVCVLLLYYPANFNLPWHLHYAKFFLAVVIFIYVVRTPTFGSTWLAYLGLISYSIYLFHQPIYSFFDEHMSSEGSSGGFSVFAATLGSTFILSVIVYHAVERPCINLGKLWSRSSFLEKFGNWNKKFR